MSSYSDNLLNQKLGLGYLSNAFATAGVDNTPHPNPRIRKYKFDIINLGTLRNVIPTAVLRKNLYADVFLSRRKQWAFENIKIKDGQKVYEAVSELSFNFYGDYSYFAPYKIRFEILNSNFFKERLTTRPTVLKNLDTELPYTRLQFPANVSNTNILTGSRDVYKPINIQNNVKTANYYISGYNNGINYANRNTFVYRQFNDVSGYIPYPNTVTIWQYPTFALDTKIALDSVYTYANMYKDMKGLLVASLRSPNGTEKIVYVSPHGIRNKFYNVIIDNVRLQPSQIQSTLVGGEVKYEYVQVNSGITVKVLDIDSEYLPSSQNVFETGLILNPYSGAKYLIQNNLRQTTPLKDTWFYKFYSGLYTSSNKTLATGTWNGVIPSGHSITLEYIATKDHRMGTNNEFRFVYQKYGDNTFIDQSIRNVFAIPHSLTRRGFGMSSDLKDAISTSNNILRKGINTLYNRYGKLLPSGVAIYPENSKVRRFRNLYTTNIYDYVSVESIPSGAYGCFKLANKQIICIDPPQ